MDRAGDDHLPYTLSDGLSDDLHEVRLGLARAETQRNNWVQNWCLVCTNCSLVCTNCCLVCIDCCLLCTNCCLVCTDLSGVYILLSGVYKL